jgi:biopolymer transport protein ExbD
MPFKPQAPPVMASPNVIPMADIMLVLLIIFMVVTPMLSKGVSVDMARVPNPEDMPNADKDDAILVGITRDGSIYLGNNKIGLEDLENKVKDQVANRLDKTVYVRADARAKFGQVKAAVDEVRAAGVDNIGLLTQKVEHKREPEPLPATTGGS